jgi:aspartate racemase
MSFESTLLYYRLINEGVRDRLGGVHSAPLLLLSVDFEDIVRLQRRGDWAAAAGVLARGAETLHAGGADMLLVCTNTMHKVAREIQAAVPVPLLDLLDVVGRHLRRTGVRRAGLLGTAYTMEDGFYAERLAREHGIETIVPEADDRAFVNRLIFEELAKGIQRTGSRRRLREVMARLERRGAESIVLGCTELELLARPTDAGVPLAATARLHAEAAVCAAITS